MSISIFCLSTKLTVAPSSSPKLHKKNQSPKPLNITLKSLTNSGQINEALQLLLSSQQSNVDSYTTVLHACISTKSLHHGQRLYLHLQQSQDAKHILENPTVKAKFITLFSSCGKLDEARQIFKFGDMGSVDESVYVAMAVGFSKNGKFDEVLRLYCEMLSIGVEPGNFAFSVALKACSNLTASKFGRSVHAQIVKAMEEPDQVVYNALLKFYSDCGSFEDELNMFDEMPDRNIATWNALIAGLFKKDRVPESFETFRRMQRGNLGFNWVSLSTILLGCARLTALHLGKEVHARILKSEACPDLLVMNALLDTYAKCGATEYCRRTFDEMSHKDLTSWNILINAYAINGKMSESMSSFDEMTEAGYVPDEVTFVSLLSGCSHAGNLNHGRILFDRMTKEFKIAPTLSHYACFVDMLGRSGKIEEALDFVKKMPVKPSGSIYGSLLNSCRMHGHVLLAEAVGKILFEIEPTNAGNYVMLSNIYANANMWEKVKMVREFMEKKGIKKDVGCSWVRVKDRLKTFVCGGGFEFRNSEVYNLFSTELAQEMEENGYKPVSGGVLHDVSEEMKIEWSCGHSERLGVMYALIHGGNGLPIRITKNLRVCVDCHAWMKCVSKVKRRKIVLRDTNRFHHFDDGKCSCNDYW